MEGEVDYSLYIFCSGGVPWDILWEDGGNFKQNSNKPSVDISETSL